MADQNQTTKRWGWNGDICAVWGEAIVLGETCAEKEQRARLIAAAPDLLDALKGLIDWVEIDHLPMDKLALQIAREAIVRAEAKNNVG